MTGGRSRRMFNRSEPWCPYQWERRVKVTIIATANDGWESMDWKGGDAGTDNTIIIAMDKHKTITANLREKEGGGTDYSLIIGLFTVGNTGLTTLPLVTPGKSKGTWPKAKSRCGVKIQ